MCFLLKIYHYLVIKRKWKRYLREKTISRYPDKYKKEKRVFKCFEGKCGYLKNLSKRTTDFYRNWKIKHARTILKFNTSGTYENFVLMALIGLVIGIVLSFVTFYLSIYHGNVTLLWAFIVRLPLLVALTSFLAFKKTARCMLILAPIQLCSTSGHVFLGGEVMMLVIEGPVMNLHHNLNVIQESSSCQQRGIASGAAEIADILFGPFSSFKQAAIEIVNGLKKLVEKLQNMLAGFKRTVMAVADAIQDATKWINSKINGCKTTVGTTYQHCMEAFTWMYDECKVKVPSIFVKMCAVTEFASNLCSSVKSGEYLCDLVYFNIDPLVTTINQRISRLWDRAYTLLYFKVNIHHEYSMDSNSKSIAEELKDKLLEAISTSLGTYFLIIYSFFKAFLDFFFIWSLYRYRHKYLRREDFDNYFITNELIKLDLHQQYSGKTSLFPLRTVEKHKYIKVNSIFLVRKELRIYSYQFLIVVKTVAFLMIVFFDYGLYKITEKCRLFMLAVMQSFGSRTEIDIVGSGFISELSRRVMRALNYMDYNFYYSHFMPCMPNPKPPNSWTNKKIYFLLVLFWFAWILQPYLLRFRHVIMDYYNPKITKKRARWLYKRIEYNRITFESLIRIKLMGKFGSDKKNISIADVLRIKFPWLIRFIGKGMSTEECVICNRLDPPLYACTTDDCPAVYCDNCYIIIHGTCSLCKKFFKHKDIGDHFQKPPAKDTHVEETYTEEFGDPCYFTIDSACIKNLDYNYQQGFVHIYNTMEVRNETNVPENDQVCIKMDEPVIKTENK